MSDRRKFRWSSGRLTTSPIEELFEPSPYRRDSLGLPRDTDVSVFGGMRINTYQGALAPTREVALTGQAATTAQGILTPVVLTPFAFDTFTDTNSTALTAHSPEVGNFWSDAGIGGTEPTIQTNRLRGVGGGGQFVGFIDGLPATNDSWYVEGTLRRYGTTGGVSGQVDAGLVGRTNNTGVYYYTFGWNEVDDEWVLQKGAAGVSILGTSTSNIFTGTGQTRLLRIDTTDNSGDVDITCYVDGVAVITTTDNSGTRITDGYGLGTLYTGVFFDDSSSTEFEDFMGVTNAQDISVTLTGENLATAQGTLGWDNTSDAYRALTGLLIQTFGGAVNSASPVGELLTLTGGLMRPTVVAGVSDHTPQTIVPKIDATIIGFNSSGALNPGWVNHGFLPTIDGILQASGEEYIYGFVNEHIRRGYFKISQITQAWTDVDGDQAQDELDTDASFARYFPRGGPEVEGVTARYNSTDHQGGFFSIDPDGVWQTMYGRVYNTGQDYQSYIAWQGTDFLTTGYYGPEIRIGRFVEASDQTNPMGFYAYAKDRALAMYPRRVDVGISGAHESLVGCRLTTGAGTITASFVGDPELVGKVLTTNSGRLTRLGTETGASVDVALTGHQLIVDGSDIVEINTSISVVPAFRIIEPGDTEWSAETALTSVTGFSHLWVKSDYMTAIPSGYGDLAYMVYLSQLPVADGVTPDSYIGIAVIDIPSRTVHANVLTLSPGTLTNGFMNGYNGLTTPYLGDRSVAEVVKRSDGTSLTQFMFAGNVVHVSWTSGTRNAPTLTVKTIPAVDGAHPSTSALDEFIVRRWESLEIRGDYVYHVLYRMIDGEESISKILINDATGTGSTWTLTNTTNSGGTNNTTWSEQTLKTNDRLGNPVKNGDFFSGYGGGRKTYLHASRREPYTDPVGASARVWVDFWDTQPEIFSIQMSGRVGRVTTSSTPNVALTGFRATTEQGLFTLISSGADRSIRPVGRRATLSQGILAPPYLIFIVDSFTDTNSTTLTAHTGDLGATWLVPSAYVPNGAIEIQSNQAWQDPGPGDTTTFKAYASGVPGKSDYKVVFKLNAQSGGNPYLLDLPDMAIGVRVDVVTGFGYYFGYQKQTQLWMLYKSSAGDPGLMDSVADPFLPGDASIEVIGNNPTRVICRIGSVTIMEVLDYGNQFGAGRVGVWANSFTGTPVSIDYINAGYYDPTVLILDGQSITTAYGTLTGPWPTGQVAYTAQGVLTPDLTGTEVALTGALLTTDYGQLEPGNIELVGFVATTAQGVITPTGGNVTIGLLPAQLQTYSGVMGLSMRETPGQVATLSQGVMGIVVDAYPTAPGLAASALQGVIAPEVSPVVSGQSITATHGTPIGGIEIDWFFVGHRLTLSQGVLTALDEHFSPLIGDDLVTAYGALTPSSAVTVALTGNSATCNVGTLKPVLASSMTGQAVLLFGGGLTPTLAFVLPAGYRANTAFGALKPALDITLLGRSATTTYGLIITQHGCTLFPTGVQCIGYVGSILNSFPPPRPETMLWAQQEVEKLFYQDLPDEDSTVAEPND